MKRLNIRKKEGRIMNDVIGLAAIATTICIVLPVLSMEAMILWLERRNENEKNRKDQEHDSRRTG